MNKKFLCLFLALIMFFLPACGPSDPSPEPDTGSSDVIDTGSNKKVTPIVQNSKSDYVILVNNSDETANTFATFLQTAIARSSGTFLPIRNMDNYLDKTEYKILIGDGKNTEISALKTQIGDGAFGVSVTEKTLVFYSDNPGGYYGLEEYFLNTMLANAEKGTWNAVVGSHIGYGDGAVTFKADSSTVYYMIYGESSGNRTFASLLANYLEETVGLTIKVRSDANTYENEILIGEVNRDVSNGITKYMKDGDYVAGVFGGSYVIHSDSRLGFTFAALDMLEELKAKLSNGTAKLNTLQNRFGNWDDVPRNEEYAEVVALANSLSGTYSSHHAEKLASASSSIKEDQALVDALVERIDGCIAVLVGSSSALHNGYIVKLDRTDYSKTAKLSGNQVLVPADYISDYFGKKLSADKDGYVNLSEYCEQNANYSLFYHATLGLAIVIPKGVTSFSNMNLSINGYTNLEYITRMVAFFENENLPEPNNNVEQSRVVVEQLGKDQESKYIYDYENSILDVLYSPAIYTRQENGKNVIYAAYEFATRLFMSTYESINTILKRSEDDGKTWETVATVKNMHWASLTEVNGKLYLIGNRTEGGNNFLIAEYDPTTGKCKRVDLGLQPGGGAPNTVLIANGRIYKAFNDAIASAAIGSDLLVASSWTFSDNPNELITRSLYEKKIGEKVGTNSLFLLEEGNVIQSYDGQLYAMYRIDAWPTFGYTALFKLSEDGLDLTLEETSGGIIKFPYTQSKFSMVYDEELEMYISLTSLSTMNYINQRNVLGLVSSKDLIIWEVVDVLLVDRQMMNDSYSMWAHAFQYVDFVLSGDDLYFLVREAVDDCYHYHDANYITMYKIENYVQFIQTRIGA